MLCVIENQHRKSLEPLNQAEMAQLKVLGNVDKHMPSARTSSHVELVPAALSDR